MCGIAGAVDLTGQRQLPRQSLQAMLDAIVHRGPDEEGFWEGREVSLGSRRLAIVGLENGRQPMTNEDGSIRVVFNGELFEHQRQRTELEQRGHVFQTRCDTELLPHLWEEYRENFFDHLQGQFAFALLDQVEKRLLLGRDRFGIAPLYWTRQGDWLLFASEIKALLASGMVTARPDPLGIQQTFSYFAQPGPMTCFEGIQLLQPGHYLDVSLAKDDITPGTIQDRAYWEMDFPDRGQERDGNREELTDQLEELLLQAVDRRLRADVPVVSYLSGGVDSSLVVAMANHLRDKPVPVFTIQVQDDRLDESSAAGIVTRHVGSEPTVLPLRATEILTTYPRLVSAAEAPVIDTSCVGSLLLAEAVHAQGRKVTLSGEGADEWLAGYPWYKVHRALSCLDVIPGLPLSLLARRAFKRFKGLPKFPWSTIQRTIRAAGGYNPWLDVHGVMGMNRLRFFNERMLELSESMAPYEELDLNRSRSGSWHSLHRALHVGAKTLLPGMLLSSKGDRVAMHSSVESRYPFLDEDVYEFLAKLHPRWKLRGFQDKYLLRRVAQRWLPSEIAWRRKAMFRAPMDSFHLDNPPVWVDQLLSPESLRKTDYFNVESVQQWRGTFQRLRPGSVQRTSVEMGLVGVMSTQLWHHLFVDASLADLPDYLHERRPSRVLKAEPLAA